MQSGCFAVWGSGASWRVGKLVGGSAAVLVPAGLEKASWRAGKLTGEIAAVLVPAGAVVEIFFCDVDFTLEMRWKVAPVYIG